MGSSLLTYETRLSHNVQQDLLASKAKAKASPKKEARKDAANDEDEEDGFDDVQLKEDAFGSDTDDDESGFLDKELQREVRAETLSSVRGAFMMRAALLFDLGLSAGAQKKRAKKPSDFSFELGSGRFLS